MESDCEEWDEAECDMGRSGEEVCATLSQMSFEEEVGSLPISDRLLRSETEPDAGDKDFGQLGGCAIGYRADHRSRVCGYDNMPRVDKDDSGIDGKGALPYYRGSGGCDLYQ